jgi:hypothetical protein
MRAGTNVAIGEYEGNGNDNRDIAVGFQPVWVVTLGDGEGDWFRPAGGGGNSYALNGTGASSNRIQDIESDGFELGDDDDVNENETDYYWIAFANTSKTASGSYDGNDNDNRLISTSGVDPAFVWVKRIDTRESAWRSDAVPGDRSLRWDTSSPGSNLIQSLVSGGFRIGDDDDVNEDDETHYYLALEP